MSVKLFIDGAAGTTGLEIRERLAGRRDVTLLALPEECRKAPQARADMLRAADIVILCLPDEAAREAVALIGEAGTRVIDASTAHRTDRAWTYGFPELSPGQRDAVAGARMVSNPGCYPTGFLALVAPLVRAGLLPASAPLGVNAVSGYSGGGKAMIADYEAAGARAPAFSTYALTLAHKHLPEMRLHAGLDAAPLFAPAVVPTHRGMLVEVPLHAGIAAGLTADQVRDCWADAYRGSAVVRLATAEGTLAVERCAGTDRLELFVFTNGADLRLVAALDNLGKGAGGAAVQNMNLMAGFDEAAGLIL